MLKKLFYSTLILLTLASCSDAEMSIKKDKKIPWVKTANVVLASENILAISGTIRARYESPLAFQVGGRILSREVNGGSQVFAGDVLFTLDPRDFDEAVRVAQADFNTQKAALANAALEQQRFQKLFEDNYVGEQELDRIKLAKREAIGRKDSAFAKLIQAKNALSYAVLKAPNTGLVMDVLAEVGQVVNLGQTVATLAQDEELEIEVFLPSKSQAPKTGRLILNKGENVNLTLREISGSADSISRSWKARYSFNNIGLTLDLGSVVDVKLMKLNTNVDVLSVPLGALDERGNGSVVWVIKKGKATPITIKVLSLSSETAKIQGNLNVGQPVISLGTHLLLLNMPVRELVQ